MEKQTARPTHPANHRSNSSNGTGPTSAPCTLLRFKIAGTAVLGMLEAEGRQKWRVIDPSGQRHEVPASEVECWLTGVSDVTGTGELAEFAQRAEELAAQANVKDAHRAVLKEKAFDAPRSLKQITALIFGEWKCDNPKWLYATLVAIARDGACFKQLRRDPSDHHPKYRARQQAQVKEIEKRVAMEREMGGWKTNLASRIARAFALPQSEKPSKAEWLSDSQDAKAFHALEALALSRWHSSQQGTSADVRTTALPLLDQLHLPRTPMGAHKTLCSCNFWHPHENVPLKSLGIPVDFSPEAMESSQQMLADPPADTDMALRADLRSLPVYTVDDPGPEEIDDGFSAERLQDGAIRIFAHVADPTRWIQAGDQLEMEARGRACSLYLPTGVVPMLPSELGGECMSLIAGQESPAMTVEAIVDHQGVVSSEQIYPSLVRPERNLTYEEAEEMLFGFGGNGSGALQLANEACNKLRDQRMRRGAIQFSMPKPVFEATFDDCSANPDVRLKQVETTTPSRELIQELMIFAGGLVGNFCHRNGLAVPFRSQKLPHNFSWSDLKDIPSEAAKAAQLRQRMTPSTMSTCPNRHDSLGLHCYVQFTSPLRRYTDLIAHMQVKAFLRGDEVPFSRNSMERLVSDWQETNSRALSASKSTARYWAIVYFSQAEPKPLRAEFLKWHGSISLSGKVRLANVLITSLGFEATAPLLSNPSPGDEVWIECTHADPIGNYLRFAERFPLEPQREGTPPRDRKSGASVERAAA